MTEEEKKTITREKHPGRVAQGHKLAGLMKKKKEEKLRSKEQSTIQSTEQSSVQSNGPYVHGVGILFVLAIGVCAFFAYNTFQAKKILKIVNDCLASQHEQKQDQPPKRRHML